MREISMHDAFRPAGTDGPGVPAITVGAGTRWLEAYQAATAHGRYVLAYGSRWLPGRLFDDADPLADALFEASRHWPFQLHVNKALSGAAPEAVARDRGTAINPAVFDAAALALTASWQRYAFPGVPGHEPDAENSALGARLVGQTMDVLRALTPGAGSYVNETDYFEPDWQDSFWAPSYPRLLEIKRRYDPQNIFRVHQGVGSEALG